MSPSGAPIAAAAPRPSALRRERRACTTSSAPTAAAPARCRSPRGAIGPESVASAGLMKRVAVAAGVPANAIVVEGTSATTEENAQHVAELMKSAGLRSAILVTSPYHQRRAAILFEREFERVSLSFRNRPADDPDWDATLWWTREPSRSLTLVELAKLGALVAGQHPG